MGQLEAALELLRLLPPDAAASNVAAICELCPHVTEPLLSAVDTPLVVEHDGGAGPAGRSFLRCDFSRDADSYRSPWTSAYFPPLPDGAQPSAALRVRASFSPRSVVADSVC